MKLIRPNMVEHRYYRDIRKFLADIICLFNKKVEEVGEEAFYSGCYCCDYINEIFKPKISSMFSEYGVKVTVYNKIDDSDALRNFIMHRCVNKLKKERIELSLVYDDDKFTEHVAKLLFAIKVSYKDGNILHMIQKDEYFGYYVSTKITPYKTYKNLSWFFYNNIHLQLHKAFIIGLNESDFDEYYEMRLHPLHDLSKEEFVHLMVDNRYNTKATLKLMISESMSSTTVLKKDYDNITVNIDGRSYIEEISSGCHDCIIFSLPIIRDDIAFPWVSYEYRPEYFGITRVAEFMII